MSIIKDALPCILPALTEIINCSWLTSENPTSWKMAEVVTLLKDRDHEIADNNRPVSLLIAVSKICERVVLNQLTDYMSQWKRYTQHQNGNRKLHSTETLNVFITDQILQSMDRKEVAALVLIDLSKAFDSIDHSILLVQLQTIGVSKSVLAWFKSYLSGRSQNLLVNPKRTKLLLLGTSQMLKKLSGTDFHMTVLGEKRILLQTVKDLGMTLD
ncbi:Hypothetical predicted protein [Paramuricea clavata]|uniref:Reverse transcriptase domain-containing protein n=1 Tax=Paramuricea clavata TaxID=317549 RepID=A0A7D9LYM8_PARCT|nr:Hypothetical predicted protein [Paramuricea clavata]